MLETAQPSGAHPLVSTASLRYALWAVLVAVQSASWIVNRVFCLKVWCWGAQTWLGVASAVLAVSILIASRFRVRTVALLAVVLMAGQWNVLLREYVLFIWRTRGFAP